MSRRLYAVSIVVIVIALGGAFFNLLPDRERARPLLVTQPADVQRQNQIKTFFHQGVIALQEKHYDDAVATFHDVLSRAPKLPEAHVNMGFALLGMKQYGAAADFFYSAMSLKPAQGNAYYGLAVALEQMDDLPGAVGAMRTYLHLVDDNSPYRTKARSSLWEWQGRLKNTESEISRTNAASDRNN